MVRKYVVLEKHVGETPLQVLEAWREKHPEYQETPLCYAGRLDPMASGKLLVLIGEECKKQEKYHDLDKEYEIEVLLDVGTDTGDVLGMPIYEGIQSSPKDMEVRSVLKNEIGTKIVPYPAFSSKTVHGKPLFLYALQGELENIEIPTHEERIYGIRLLKRESLSKEAVHKRIQSYLSLVPRTMEPSKELGADFRQDTIRETWTELFAAMPNREFTVLKLRVSCASGTYMRTLAERIGTELRTSALALSIRRTRIGKHVGRGFWLQEYR